VNRGKAAVDERDGRYVDLENAMRKQGVRLIRFRAVMRSLTRSASTLNRQKPIRTARFFQRLADEAKQSARLSRALPGLRRSMPAAAQAGRTATAEARRTAAAEAGRTAAAEAGRTAAAEAGRTAAAEAGRTAAAEARRAAAAEAGRTAAAEAGRTTAAQARRTAAGHSRIAARDVRAYRVRSRREFARVSCRAASHPEIC